MEEVVVETPPSPLGLAGGLGGSENEMAKSPRNFVASVTSLSGSRQALSCLPPPQGGPTAPWAVAANSVLLGSVL